jgi:hypothetical protein
VRFEIDADLPGIYVCHCSICRRSTGGSGIAVVVFSKERFRWIRGEDRITSWSKPGTDWHKWFCSACGSPVPGENDATTMFAPAGCLTDGADSLEVIHHVWVGSKAPWDVIGDSAKQHAEGFRS